MSTVQLPVTGNIVEVSIELLLDNPKNYFRVIDDKELNELCNSISSLGVIHPIVVKPISDGKYRIISGHMRKLALLKMGYKTAQIIIRDDLDEIEEEMLLIEANIRTRPPSWSELAKSIERMKILIADKRKDPKQMEEVNGRRARAIIAEKVGISQTHVERMDKINQLIPEIKTMLDNEKLTLTAALYIANMPENVQKQFYRTIKDEGFQEGVINIKKLTDEKNKTIDNLNIQMEEGHRVVLRMEKEMQNLKDQLSASKGDEIRKENLKKEIKELELKKQNFEHDLIDLKNAQQHLEKEKVTKHDYGTDMMKPLNQPMKQLSEALADVKYAAGKVEEDPYGGLRRNLTRHVNLLEEYVDVLTRVRDRLNNKKNKDNKEDKKCDVC